MEQTKSTQNLPCYKCEKITTSNQEAENKFTQVENKQIQSLRKEPQDQIVCQECQLTKLAEQSIQSSNIKQLGKTFQANSNQNEKKQNEKCNNVLQPIFQKIKIQAIYRKSSNTFTSLHSIITLQKQKNIMRKIQNIQETKQTEFQDNWLAHIFRSQSQIVQIYQII